VVPALAIFEHFDATKQVCIIHSEKHVRRKGGQESKTGTARRVLRIFDSWPRFRTVASARQAVARSGRENGSKGDERVCPEGRKPAAGLRVAVESDFLLFIAIKLKMGFLCRIGM